MSALTEKWPACHAEACLSLHANRVVIDYALFCEVFFNRYFIAGDCAIPTKEMLDEVLVESVRYHGDGDKYLEVSLGYASCVFAAK